MKKIDAIIRPEKLDSVKRELSILGISGMTVTKVEGHGKQPAQSGIYRGQPYSVDLLPKIKIEIVVLEEILEQVIKKIIEAAKTGHVGDGKIFVSAIEDVIRIRTEESGEKAI